MSGTFTVVFTPVLVGLVVTVQCDNPQFSRTVTASYDTAARFVADATGEIIEAHAIAR